MKARPASQAPAVVARGSDEIGAAIVRSLAAAGHPVSFGHQAGGSASAELERELADAGHLAAAFELDALDSSSLNSFQATSTERFGPPLCVVANFSASTAAPAQDLGQEEWNGVVDASLSATFRLIQQFLPEMRAYSYGRVVVVGSAASLVGCPQQAALCASAAGMEGLVRSLAVEFGPHDVLVNGVAPGYIEEGGGGLAGGADRKQIRANTALRRMGTAGEVAEAVRFLCGPGPSAMTGCVLRVDGGLTA
ncbi:SDR family NAD(P)-dependent oxidoreductase [Candidatus Poriferisocius sp.]|uniref:SDR family NAD(P)-dependent oxidoreductase n=1 Tax=Candidatus Poriferisocius sp. TaxID=3101276 RepID=UPI003B01BCCF